MKKIKILLSKDITLLFREPSRLIISFIFILFAIILFNYALLSQTTITQELIWGLFWLLFIFSLLLLLSAIIEIDQKNENFQGIQISSLTPTQIYLERVVLISLTLTISSILIFILTSFFYSNLLLNTFNFSLLLIIIAIASLSSLISLMISIQNTNQIILYILFVILNTPLILIGIQLSISTSRDHFLDLISFGIALFYFFIGIIFSEVLLKGNHE